MSKIAIKVEKLVKIYRLYDRPIDRMKEALSFSRKKYSKEHYALNNISFEIKKGETVGILGSNGSGKSTILKIITGVLTQTSGDVTVNGKISALLELGAGFNPEYTGLENIYLNGTMMGYSREQMKKKVNSILESADIGEFIYQPVLGIAIRSIADDYVCGLNTLLDRIEIPWKYGRNVMELEYIFGILAMGGKYYFDVALFEETATVQIQYKSRIKELTVSADYIG